MASQKPWEQEKALTESDVRTLLQVNFPELALTTISALGDGWDNTTWLVNNTWVFRVPKHQEAAQLLRSEINVLTHLPTFDVDYPKPELICLNPKNFIYLFYGHRYLAGVSADRASLTLDERAALAPQLGAFLKKLHAFPIERAKALGISFDHIGRVDVKKRYLMTKEHFHYLVEHNLISDANSFLREFETNLEMKVPETWVLGHGDFYARHILLDEHKNLSAVIDWGDCELLSPAVDLAIIYQFLPISAHKLFWEAYGEVDQTIRTIAKLRAIYSSATISWYAHQVGDQSLLAEGLLGLEYLQGQHT